jgi:hypothetical protein
MRSKLLAPWLFTFVFYAIAFGGLTALSLGGGFERAAIRGIGFGILLVLFQAGRAVWSRRRSAVV